MNTKIRTVLLADSDQESVTDLKDKLLEEGFRVYSAGSGREALSYVRKRKINIAVIDADLKDIEGYKIVPLIKDINENIAVIITTKENSVELERKCRETGIIYYAIKPLNVVQFIEVIKIALNHFEESNFI